MVYAPCTWDSEGIGYCCPMLNQVVCPYVAEILLYKPRLSVITVILSGVNQAIDFYNGTLAVSVNKGCRRNNNFMDRSDRSLSGEDQNLPKVLKKTSDMMCYHRIKDMYFNVILCVHHNMNL